MLESTIHHLKKKNPYKGNIVLDIKPSNANRDLNVLLDYTKGAMVFDTGQRLDVKTSLGAGAWGKITIPANSKSVRIEFETDESNYPKSLFAANPNDFFTSVVDWESSPLNQFWFGDWTGLTSVPPYLPKRVTSLRNTFYGCTKLNDPNISLWDTSNVTTLHYAFYRCLAFNQPLDKWDMRKVNTLNNAFRDCVAFNQDLSSWDTSAVESLASMFMGASSFNKPVNNWNTANVTDMSGLFYEALAFDHTIANWNVGKVTTINTMLKGCKVYNQDLSSLVFKSSVSRSIYDSGCTAWNAAYRPKFTG